MKLGTLIVGILLGGIITFFGSKALLQTDHNNTASTEKKPLYWVAPMDANYKRDAPGLSPMGMALIPFYGTNGGADEVGTIKISPSVENNLGVRTGLVELLSLHSHINTIGYVNFDEDYMVHIHPRVKGWIEKLYIKAEGDPVKKGEPLYDIYSPEMVNAQEELLLALERNKERLVRAAKNRLLSLQVPNSAIEELSRTKKVKQTITFYSPQNGVIDTLNIRQGFYVQPGTTMMSIGSLERVWINAEVFERQASEISIGSPVDMQLEYLPGKEWKGSVDYIYPTLDAKTRTLKVRLKFENKEELLKPGMFAQVIIHGKYPPKTLTIPREALIRTGSSNRVVLALGEGKFKSINVKMGRSNDEFVEILGGLNEGEKVVTSAQFLLDSESSKTSDFKRMEALVPEDPKKKPEMKISDKEIAIKEWVHATIKNVITEDKKLKVAHSAIPNWKWPQMTMKFGVSDALDFAQFKENMEMEIEITKTKDNKYIITDVKFPSKIE